MLFRAILLCLAVTIAGAVIISHWLLFDITPPAPQETTRIDVGIAQLKPEDKWLENVRFQVVPLDGVKSAHRYAILLMTPPTGGVHPPAASTVTLDLTASSAFWTAAANTPGSHSFPEGIQPIQIERSDFGTNGDQVGVKFIDELVRIDKSYYQTNHHLMIGSSPTP